MPQGFSAIELLIVISIVGILAAIALPSFNTVIARMRVRTSADSILSLLYAAKSEAVKRAGGVVIRPTGATWSTGFTVALTDVNGTVLRTVPAFNGVTVTHLSNINLISVDRWGKFTGGGSLTANFSVVSTNVSSASKAICVGLGGRIYAKNGSTCP